MLSRLFKRRKAPCQYDKLEQNQIRLIVLQPGSGHDRLVCTLRTVDLLAYDDIGAESSIKGLERYEAISYVWGNPHDTSDIDCNGCAMSITKSLADALYAFRHAESVRILWADALCINQKDIQERAQQVTLMGLIYWKACRVRVWLGREDDVEGLHDAQHAIRVIKEMANARRRPEAHQTWSDIMYEEPASITSVEWTAIDRLLDRPWFTRVWVVQEQGVARNVVFHCGEHQFTRHEMEDFQEVLRYAKPPVSSQNRIYSQMLELGDHYWRSCWGNTRLELGSDPKEAETFLDILKRARGLTCTDPRDSIYAFLGHPSAFKQQLLDIEPYQWYPRNYYSGRKTIVAPDYRRSNTRMRLYHELATSAVASMGLGLNVLSHVAHTYDTIALDYPSWVPRWDVAGPSTFLGSEIYFAASGTYPSTTFELTSFNRRGFPSQLSFKAWRLDRVRCVRSVPVTAHLAESLDLMALLLSDAPKMQRSAAIPIPNSLTYPYEEPFVLACASTMTAGLISAWHAPYEPADEHPHQLVRNFHAYYRRQHSLDDRALSNEELEHAEYFETNVRVAAARRLMFITYDGRLGLGPPVMECSDHIWIPVGAKMPILLRQCANGRFKVVGEAYIYGVMRGEAVREKSENDAEVVVCI